MQKLVDFLGDKLYSLVMDVKALEVPYVDVSFDGVTKRVKEHGVSNCYGTALFLAGSAKKDRYSDGFKMNMSLKGKESLKIPEIGCLVLFYHRSSKDDSPPKICDCSNGHLINHAGIITGVDPAYVTHRFNTRGPIEQQQPLEEIMQLHRLDARFVRL